MSSSAVWISECNKISLKYFINLACFDVESTSHDIRSFHAFISPDSHLINLHLVHFDNCSMTL